MNYKLLKARIIIITLAVLLSPVVSQAAQPKMTTPPYINTAEWDKNSPITITGKTAFKVDTLVQCILKGRIAADRADRTELLDIYYVSVNENKEWLIAIPQVYIPVWEGYEIEVSPVKGGEAKEYYYIDVLAPDRPEQRAKSIGRLWASFLDAFTLDAELNKLINSVEDAKQDEPKIKKIIQKPFDVYKTKEEILADLIKQWTGWEKDWLKKVDTLTMEVNKYNRMYFIFPATQERIQQYVATIKEQYIRYRQRFLGVANEKTPVPALSHHIIVETSSWFRNTDEERNNSSRLISKELAGKYIKDISVWIEHLVSLYPVNGGKTDNQRLILWKQACDYFGKLREELGSYEESKTPFPMISEFDEMSDLITLLIKKSNSDPLSPVEIQNHITMLKNRLELLYVELR
jgi:hypothetical protein